MERLRTLIQRLRDDDVIPSARISFALLYAGTELGLVVTDDPVKVFRGVLGGNSQAVAALRPVEDSDRGIRPYRLVPGSTSIH